MSLSGGNLINPLIQKVLDTLHLQNPKLIGKGGEGFVFELDDQKVIKIYNPMKRDYLESRMQFEKLLAGKNLPFELPEIYEINSVDETLYSIDKKLTGVTLDKIFPSLNQEEKRQVLKNYFEALKHLHTIKMPDFPFGQVIKAADYTTAPSWQQFLTAKMDDKIGYAKKWLEKDVEDFDQKAQKFYQIIADKLEVYEKTLVHGDYYYGNVMVEGITISSVFDFSPLTVIGDPRLDVSGAIIFCELDPMFTENDINYLQQLAVADYGGDIEEYIKYYRIYYSFYFANSYEFDQKLYNWCIKNLNNQENWYNSQV